MSTTHPRTDAPIGGSPAPRYRILVFESDRLLKSLIVEWLHMAGHEAVCAGETKSAGEVPADRELVLVDLPAPQRVARDAVTRLRKAFPGTPIIAMSADIVTCGREAREALARELGAAAVLVKPFTQDALLSTIARVRA